jgi:hypothetical protein
MIQNASCDPEGEKATPRTPPVPTLNDLLGQGGVIFLPASCRSLLAEHTLFQVTRSATNGRIKLACVVADVMRVMMLISPRRLLTIKCVHNVKIRFVEKTKGRRKEGHWGVECKVTRNETVAWLLACVRTLCMHVMSCHVMSCHELN